MIIKRSKTFSDKKKDSTVKDIKLAAAGGLLAGGRRLGTEVGYREIVKSRRAGITKDLVKENKDILGKLRKVAKEQKTKVTNINSHNNTYNRIFQNKDKYKKLLKDEIELGTETGGNRSAVSLAHELGHSQHLHNRSGSIIGKAAHKLRYIQMGGVERLNKRLSKVGMPLTFTGASRLTGMATGLASGINAGKKEKEGKKEGILSKTAWITAPTAYLTPTLISEGEASRQGLKMLKKAGASKTYMETAKKGLGHSLGSYSALLVAPIAMGYGARQIGKVIGRKIAKKDDSIVKRNKLFSGDDKKDARKWKALAAGSGAGLVGAGAGNLHYYNKLGKSKISAPDNEAVKEKLLQKANDQGIRAVEGKSPIGISYYRRATRSGAPKKVRESIVLDKAGGDASVLAHELGHAQFFDKSRSKNIVGIAAHRLHRVSDLSKSGISFVNGLHSGINSERLRSKGKRESTWNKVKSVAIPAALMTPELIREGVASLKGLKMMKQAGASKQLLGQSKKAMGNAYKTYLAVSAHHILEGTTGHALGKVIGKKIYGPKDPGDEKKNKGYGPA
jgi:hypothetical protein